ncbi:unnamed protein product [Cylindrotheca closterium]|uniref:Guanylate kinase-like domain-containing protein n=1 Tax=Cylindrotheca closterium TaxID=2856 RepID=A0AAD2FWC4_9STRA|nr:unnamed protein product [Cylindrotheca closterium]
MTHPCLFILLVILSSKSTLGFVVPSSQISSNAVRIPSSSAYTSGATGRTYSYRTSSDNDDTSSSSQLYAEYVPQDPGSPTVAKKSKSLHPQVGDLVRYYDLDGGDQKGQELVGKISYIVPVLSKKNSGADGNSSSQSKNNNNNNNENNKEFLVDLTQLEDTGDGYYAEFSSQKRMGKKANRNLKFVSPIVASYVRAEQAYKVPLTNDGQLRVRQETYDLDDYEGPIFKVDQGVVAQDGLVYGTLKFNLLKNAAIAGLAGSIVVNIIKGPEDGAIYLAGAVASVGYLFFLSVKTDTIFSDDAKIGSGVANLRFLMPILLLVGVALYNQSQGEYAGTTTFDTVTPEQFGCAVLGFLTYRVPLFLGQVQDALKEEVDAGGLLPGSAGIAMQLMKGDAAATTASGATLIANQDQLLPVLLVSGPQFTGRKELVQKLLESDDRLVSPRLVDRQQDGVTFERLEDRGGFLQVDPSGRYGLTKEAILEASQQPMSDTGGSGCDKVVVVDADVGLARQMQNLSGTRLVGVWVGLKTVAEFEEQLEAGLEAGTIVIPEDEPKESFMRGKVKEIVQEIDFGLGSGIFEFTILNDGSEKSLEELKDAAEYCFK